jgi:hypothetical protein
MKESVLKSKVLKMLNDFDTMEDIQPSANWNQSLMNRLSSLKPHSNSNFLPTRFVVVVLLFVLVNLGFILSSVIGDSNQALQRNSELLAISKELLINPISLNN